VLAVADRVLVLRGGRLVAQMRAVASDKASLLKPWWAAPWNGGT
jgi:ABC-type sugar transport system ATPase subunit